MRYFLKATLVISGVGVENLFYLWKFLVQEKTLTSYSKFSEIQTYDFTFKALKKETRGAIKSLSLVSKDESYLS